MTGRLRGAHQLASSSLHGVTTVLTANCGVGFAPCHDEDRQILMRLMEGVEDIPGIVLAEGIPWNWKTFPDYLDALAARRYDADVATQIGHAPLRVYVMGERGAAREPATCADKTNMARLAGEAVRAGALGFSTSRTTIHRSSDGSPTPSLGAAEDELATIARGLTAEGRGVLQLVSDFDDVDCEFGMLRRVVEQSRRPMSLSLLQHEHAPERWRRVLEHVRAAVEDGLEIKAQVGARPVAIILSFALSLCPFSQLPSYEALANEPPERRRALLRDPKVRARILAERHHDENLERRVANFDNLYPLHDPPEYEPIPESSIAAIARREGRRPTDVAYDLLLENDAQAMLYRPLYNYADKDLEVVREMLNSSRHDLRFERWWRTLWLYLRRELSDVSANALGTRPLARRTARVAARRQVADTGYGGRGRSARPRCAAAGLQSRHQRHRFRSPALAPAGDRS